MISIIVPFLNAEQFLQEAIESVLAQTYEDWELLLVDDGSTETSPEIALQYVQQHPKKVRYLEHPGHLNRGASASRNLGSNNAKGEYIAFLDADDIWLPHKLGQQVAILKANPEVALVYGPAMWWYSWKGDSGDLQRDSVHEIGVQPNTLIEPPRLITTFLQNEDATPLPSSILVRRAVHIAIGGFEETFRSIYDDQVYCTKVCLGMPVFASSECWLWYRQHPNQRCYVTNQAGQYNSVRLAFLRWLQNYLLLKGVRDGKLWVGFQKAMWPYRHPNLVRLKSQMIRAVKWVAK
jgi:glycosyltransferase involved in cell wall biosynthesis